MEDLNEQIANSLEALKKKFESGSTHQSKVLEQAKIIQKVALITAAVFILVLIQTILVAIATTLGIPDLDNMPWAANLSSLLSPMAIVVSVLMASYLALFQLSEKVKRDRVEHAHNLCSSAPDINIVYASMAPLKNHFKEAYQHCIEASQLDAPESSSNGSWEAFVNKLDHMTDHFPSTVRSIARNLRADHREEIGKITEALAFFEKTAIAISEKHADDSVFWARYNVAGISIWINSFPVIIDYWIQHADNKYLIKTATIGLPFEHFEAWLRYHGEQEGNEDLHQLLKRLANIRAKLLKRSKAVPAGETFI